MERPSEGLRARKKRAAREAIAAAARALFAERGYDAVTVAEIAVAADVSEKTVFNHFAAKEDLVLPADALPEPSVAAYRTATEAMLAGLGPRDAELAPIIAGHPVLRERLVTRDAVTADGDLAAGVVARALAWTHRSAYLAALDGLAADEDPRRVAKRLRAEAARAYDRLDAG